MACEELISPSWALGESWLLMLVLTACTRVEICSATALQWLISWDCDASFLLDAAAPCAAAMHCVETAAACLAATSSLLIAFFFSALEAAALVTALQGQRDTPVHTLPPSTAAHVTHTLTSSVRRLSSASPVPVHLEGCELLLWQPPP